MLQVGHAEQLPSISYVPVPGARATPRHPASLRATNWLPNDSEALEAGSELHPPRSSHAPNSIVSPAPSVTKQRSVLAGPKIGQRPVRIGESSKQGPGQ